MFNWDWAGNWPQAYPNVSAVSVDGVMLVDGAVNTSPYEGMFNIGFYVTGAFGIPTGGWFEAKISSRPDAIVVWGTGYGLEIGIWIEGDVSKSC